MESPFHFLMLSFCIVGGAVAFFAYILLAYNIAQRVCSFIEDHGWMSEESNNAVGIMVFIFLVVFSIAVMGILGIGV